MYAFYSKKNFNQSLRTCSGNEFYQLWDLVKYKTHVPRGKFPATTTLTLTEMMLSIIWSNEAFLGCS